MQHFFTLGIREIHQVEIRFERFFGKFEIRVDTWPAVSEHILFGFELTRTWNIWVGIHEKHLLPVQKTRPAFAPAFRPHTWRIYVDNILVNQFDA
jgi:hypothetical protein